MSIFLGIDPWIATVGYGVVERTTGGRLVATEWGVLRTEARLDMGTRLLEIATDMRSILNGFGAIAACGIEELLFTNNQTSAMKVAEARGVLRLVLAEKSIRVHEFTPTAVKAGLTGSGRAAKPQMQRAICALLGMTTIPTPDDAADALAIACMAALATRHEITL